MRRPPLRHGAVTARSSPRAPYKRRRNRQGSHVSSNPEWPTGRLGPVGCCPGQAFCAQKLASGDHANARLNAVTTTYKCARRTLALDPLAAQRGSAMAPLLAPALAARISSPTQVCHQGPDRHAPVRPWKLDQGFFGRMIFSTKDSPNGAKISRQRPWCFSRPLSGHPSTTFPMTSQMLREQVLVPGSRATPCFYHQTSPIWGRPAVPENPPRRSAGASASIATKSSREGAGY